MTLHAVPDPGSDPAPADAAAKSEPPAEFVYIVAIRSAEDITAEQWEQLSTVIGGHDVGEVGGGALALVKKPYAEMTANDNGYLRQLGFPFEAANDIVTVAWRTAE